MFTTDWKRRGVVRSAVAVLLISVAPVCLAADDGEPFFKLRGWETMVEGLWCGSRGGGTYWYKNPFYLNYLDMVLREAPKYKANALILMGRHNYAEIHTFVSYRKWPLLHRIYKDRGLKDRELQQRRLNELIDKAREQGVGVYLWDHEVHIPAEMPKCYPSIVGKGARYCPCAPDLWRFMADKYDEFLERVDGAALGDLRVGPEVVRKTGSVCPTSSRPGTRRKRRVGGLAGGPAGAVDAVARLDVAGPVGYHHRLRVGARQCDMT